MLGTAPADATAFLTVTRDMSSTGGVKLDQQPLPGTDYQAVALQFDDPKDVDGYVDTIWTNAVDEVRSANGTMLPTVPIAGGDRFFVARESGVMGVFMAGGRGGSTRPLSGKTTTTMGYGERPDNGAWAWTSATLLPEGAHDVSFTWAHAQSHTKVTVKSLGTGEVAYAQATAPGTDWARSSRRSHGPTRRAHGIPTRWSEGRLRRLRPRGARRGPAARSHCAGRRTRCPRGRERGPATIGLAQVLVHRGAVREESLHLLVARAVARSEVEVEPVLDRLSLGHLDEEQPLPPVRAEDHALLVAWQVGVLLVLRPTEHLRPPHRLGVGVARVDRRVRDP